MRSVQLAGLDVVTPILGFGCASLGSRVSKTEGRKSIEKAIEAGLTWFDLAPAYGGGRAEEIFSEIIRDRRDTVQICTKVGLLPPHQGILKKILTPMARKVISIGSLRATLRRSGFNQNRKLNLTPDLLISSLEESLRRINTDYVDVYALHNATPDDLVRDEILETLDRIIRSGKVRAVSVAGNISVAEAALQAVELFNPVQFPMPVTQNGSKIFKHCRAKGVGCVAHSVFRVNDALSQVKSALEKDQAFADEAASAGFGGAPTQAAAALLLSRAFELNRAGVTLVSMFSKRNLETAVRLASQENHIGGESLLRKYRVFGSV
jgi:aryl-alcohol dehydrogenase-like predicted oxidoreductase